MNTWGLYPWSPELGLDLIHPDDLAIVQVESPYGELCEVISRDGPYLLLRFGRGEFRGKGDLFRPVAAPAFQFGQWVKTKPPRSPKSGIVRCIGWHFKGNSPLFFLTVNGTIQRSRYLTEELELELTET